MALPWQNGCWSTHGSIRQVFPISIWDICPVEQPGSGVGSFSEYSALVVLTDHAQSGRVWVEQLQNRKTVDPVLTNQPLLMVASAQAGPLLQPYVDSRQITGMISGLVDAARYERLNNNRPGIARSYWDTFGIGLMMSVAEFVYRDAQPRKCRTGINGCPSNSLNSSPDSLACS
jgi:hypothetical protein